MFSLATTPKPSKFKSKSRIPLNYSTTPLSTPITPTASLYDHRHPTTTMIGTQDNSNHSIPFPTTLSPSTSNSTSSLDPVWVATQSRQQLEMILNKADQEIRLKSADLEMAAAVGKALLEENTMLRNRQDSLLLHRSPLKPRLSTSSDLRDRQPLSTRMWSSTTISTPRSAKPNQDEWDDTASNTNDSHPRTSFDSIGSRSSIDVSTTPRSRLSSVSSLFARPNYATSASPSISKTTTAAQLQELDKANYALTIQLLDIKSDAEQAELEGTKKLRKMAIELKELRQQLDRAEVRSSSSGNDISGVDKRAELRASRQGEEKQYTSMDEDDGKPELSSSSSTARRTRATFTPTPKLDRSLPTVTSPSTPTKASTTTSRRTPGSITHSRTISSLLTSSTPIPSSSSTHSSSIKSSNALTTAAQPVIVAQLMSKISELESVNAIISEERLIMEERLERAQSDVDNMRKKCEELEDELLFDEGNRGVEWHEQTSIGWTENDTEPEGRTKQEQRKIGNQKMIESQRRRLSSTSPPSSPQLHPSKTVLTSEEDGDEDVEEGSARTATGRSREYSFSPRKTRRQQLGKGRTLASELGLKNVWDHHSYDDSEEEEEEARYSRMKRSGGKARASLDSLGSLGGAYQYDDEEYEIERDEFRRRTDSALGSSTTQSRRALALRRLGLSSLSHSPSYHQRTNINSDDDDDDDAVSFSSTSSFAHIAPHDQRRSTGTDYYPVALLARYHPRMVAMRIQDRAVQKLGELVVYLRFFLLLGLAILWALWQGPKKTLKMIDQVPQGERPRTRRR